MDRRSPEIELKSLAGETFDSQSRRRSSIYAVCLLTLKLRLSHGPHSPWFTWVFASRSGRIPATSSSRSDAVEAGPVVPDTIVAGRMLKEHCAACGGTGTQIKYNYPSPIAFRGSCVAS